MEGITYVTDETGARRFVQVDLAVYGSEWLEDLVDGLVAESRRGEETVPLDDVIADLKAAGKLADEWEPIDEGEESDENG